MSFRSTHEACFFGGCCLLIVALISSPFLLSLTLFGLGFLAATEVERPAAGRWQLRLATQRLRRLHPRHIPWPIWAFTLYFWLVLLSGWQTDAGNWSYWLAKLRIKLPLLLLPLTLHVYGRIDRLFIQRLLLFTLAVLLLTAVGISIYYALHFGEVNAALQRGQPMPTPRNHIRYAMLMAFGSAAGLWLWQSDYPWPRPVWRRVVLGVSLLLMAFLHLLSVRTGLLGLYGALAVGLLYLAWTRRRYGLAALGLVVLLAAPLLAYRFVPSFRAKMAYVRYDLLMHQEGQGERYADSGRVVSLRVGWDVFRAHPLLGVGAGNLREAVHQRFAADYPAYQPPLMPHNQFLYTAAGTGLWGLALLLLALLLPLRAALGPYRLLLYFLYAVYGLAMLLEHALENTVGVVLFAFWMGLLLTADRPPREPPAP